MNLSIRFADVYQRTGKVIESYPVGFEFAPTVLKSERYGLVLSWPREYQFLSVAVKPAGTGPAASGPGFVDGLPGLDRVFGEYKLDYAAKVPEALRKARRFTSGFLTRGAPLALEFTVDTDDEVFCDWAAQWLRSQLEEVRGRNPGASVVLDQIRTFMELEIFTYALDARDSEDGRVRVVLEPVRQPKYFDGYVAVDFGTTATTAVLLPGGPPSMDKMALLDASGLRGVRRAEAAPTETKLNIEAVDWHEADGGSGEAALHDHPGSAEWSIGPLAEKGPPSGLVLGAKRLAAGPAWEGKLIVTAYDKLKADRAPRDQPRHDVPLLNRHAADLFLCRMFQRFCEATNTRPKYLAVTYPTTFSSRELRQLKEVVARGWLRMRVMEHTPDRIANLTEKKTLAGERWPHGELRLALDEATAAAFFFVHRKITAPGGLLRFRYLYPNGLNVLLYDCGGGTTDIALVTARLDPVAGKGHAHKLRISVRARSGLRGFGGDNITRQIARLIKAKLARALWGNPALTAQLGIAGPCPAFPGPDAPAPEVEAFLARNADAFDKLVPTRFDPRRTDPVTQRNREHVLKLWDWAEALKQRVTGAAAPVPVAAARDRLVTFLARTAHVSEEQMLATVNQIQLTRAEVDRMIEPPIRQSIRNCNNLIRERLTDQGEDVHWVVAVGNASRYPLIQEELKRSINVMFLEAPEPREARFGIDLNNLKYAVAKGAVLALGTLENIANLDVSFETDLSERLPFEVAHYDAVKGAYRILFAEGKRYDELQPETVNFQSSAGGAAAELGNAQARQKWFNLYRRWPGQTKEEYEVYARYYFRDDVHGPVTVKYDLQKEDFVVTDSRQAEGEMTLPDGSGDLFVSPVQRGDL